MKRNLIIALICLLFALYLNGCGSDAAPTSAAEQPVEETAAPTATLPDAVLEPDTPEEEPEENPLYEKALTFVDQPLEDLIAEIGEPNSSEYASSCLVVGEDGEDGILYYDGFFVTTYRHDGAETVIDVIPN